MELSNNDIQAHIQRANQLRSDAMGELISLAWHKCVLALRHLMHAPTPALVGRS